MGQPRGERRDTRPGYFLYRSFTIPHPYREMAAEGIIGSGTRSREFVEL